MNKLLDKMTDYFPFFSQIFRFGIVGVCAASTHFTVVVSLVQFASIVPLAANVVGFMVAFQVSYWGHKLWTFSDTVVLHRTAVPKLLFVQILNLAANESLFYIFLSHHLPYQIALLLVLTILPIFTFTFSKLWVFR